MDYAEGMKELAERRRQISALRDEMRAVQQAVVPQKVRDYEFTTSGGHIRLSALFADKADLLIVHNMGRSCPYCTLWADGYNGIYEHLASRAAFVVSSPDSPQLQVEFARSRGWRFPMVSHQGTTFATDMGYYAEKGYLPGLSVLERRDGDIVRVSDSGSCPGDDFCALWHLFDLLPGGRSGWHPRLSYATAP